MDRCVVLVDAGYLLGAAASLLAGEPSRSRITVDHAAVVQGLRERAERETGQPLLRIYWFDGAPDRVPQPEHRRLRVMPRVTVRLGALTRSDGRWAQKGVDAAMHAELSELARNRACSDVVLVTGDGDLLPGMMSAKEHGVAVHLWAVQAADGDYNQSEDLVAEADERRVLDREWITRAVRATRRAPAPGPQATRARRSPRSCPPRSPSPPLPRGPAEPRRTPPSRPAARQERPRARARRTRHPARPPRRAHAEGPRRPRRRPRRRPAATARAAAGTQRHAALVVGEGLGRSGPAASGDTSGPAHPGPAHHRRAALGRPRGGHHRGQRRPLRGRPGLRPPLDRPARRLRRACRCCPPSTRGCRTASTASCCATPPGSGCSPTRTTRSTNTTATPSGRGSGARSTPARSPPAAPAAPDRLGPRGAARRRARCRAPPRPPGRAARRPRAGCVPGVRAERARVGSVLVRTGTEPDADRRAAAGRCATVRGLVKTYPAGRGREAGAPGARQRRHRPGRPAPARSSACSGPTGPASPPWSAS